MAEKSISFKGPMVRAILSGSKTVTRRVLKPQPSHLVAQLKLVGTSRKTGAEVFEMLTRSGMHVSGLPDGPGCVTPLLEAPYAVGDHLWVREAWRTEWEHDAIRPVGLKPGVAGIRFEEEGAADRSIWGRYRPPMFMPRWASRITLEVTGVKVERLCDISEEEAKAEGVFFYADQPEFPWTAYDGCSVSYRRASEAFQFLWDSINGEREGASWEANPWVAAISFRSITP
jgi:hypothetical protein